MDHYQGTFARRQPGRLGRHGLGQESWGHHTGHAHQAASTAYPAIDCQGSFSAFSGIGQVRGFKGRCVQVAGQGGFNFRLQLPVQENPGEAVYHGPCISRGLGAVSIEAQQVVGVVAELTLLAA